jgi:hypothetical protein
VFDAVFNPEELVVLQLGSHRHELPNTTMFLYPVTQVQVLAALFFVVVNIVSH